MPAPNDVLRGVSPIQFETHYDFCNHLNIFTIRCTSCYQNISCEYSDFYMITQDQIRERYLEPTQTSLREVNCNHLEDNIIDQILLSLRQGQRIQPDVPRFNQINAHALDLTIDQYDERYLQPAMQAMARDAIVDGVAMARNVLVKKSIVLELMAKQKDKLQESGYAKWSKKYDTEKSQDMLMSGIR